MGARPGPSPTRTRRILASLAGHVQDASGSCQLELSLLAGSTKYVRQMYPVTVRVCSPEPPHTGDLVTDTEAREVRCDYGDVGYAESELHLCDWFVACRKELENGTGIADMTVDQVWSASLVVVEESDSYRAVERCGLVDVADEKGEL